ASNDVLGAVEVLQDPLLHGAPTLLVTADFLEDLTERSRPRVEHRATTHAGDTLQVRRARLAEEDRERLDRTGARRVPLVVAKEGVQVAPGVVLPVRHQHDGVEAARVL